MPIRYGRFEMPKTLTKEESTGMQRGFLPLPHYALQPLVRAIREVEELVQGLKGPAPASHPSQVRMRQPHAHRSLPDCRCDMLHRV